MCGNNWGILRQQFNKIETKLASKSGRYYVKEQDISLLYQEMLQCEQRKFLAEESPADAQAFRGSLGVVSTMDAEVSPHFLTDIIWSTDQSRFQRRPFSKEIPVMHQNYTGRCEEFPQTIFWTVLWHSFLNSYTCWNQFASIESL